LIPLAVCAEGSSAIRPTAAQIAHPVNIRLLNMPPSSRVAPSRHG
jgi:hypothetical protein